MIEEFKKNNIKITKQRTVIYNLIKELEDKATIKNIYLKTKMDKTTIYRIIKLFLNKKIIVQNINNNEVCYSLNKPTHYHYMTCIKCHNKIKIDFCPINYEIKKLTKEENFKLISHSIILEGICRNCKNM